MFKTKLAVTETYVIITIVKCLWKTLIQGLRQFCALIKLNELFHEKILFSLPKFMGKTVLQNLILGVGLALFNREFNLLQFILNFESLLLNLVMNHNTIDGPDTIQQPRLLRIMFTQHLLCLALPSSSIQAQCC